MLRVTASANAAAAKQYYGSGLSRSDYYIDGQEVAGVWGGKAAERLGLRGPVDATRYFAMCDNRDPNTGRQLTPRVKDNRRVGYDFTFSAPKSVSVLYELTGDERVLSAFRESVKDTMTEIETEMKTRVRAKGADADRATGNLAYAEFVHFTARPVDGMPDPHLHAHCFAFNVTYDEVERRWKAGQFGDLKRDASYYEAAFDARLAHRLESLGYATAKDPKYSFEVAGVPETVIDKFSRRRNQIEAQAAARGITSAKGKHAIGYFGRENKTLDLAKRELRQEWASRLSSAESAALDAVRKRRVPAAVAVAPERALDFAVEHSFVTHSTLSEKRLKAEALRYGVGSVLPAGVNAAVANRGDLITVERDGERITTTRDVLTGEIGMLRFARDGRGKCAPFATDAEFTGLSAEQKAAALHVLESRDRVTGIRGGAGTGKTRLMTEAVSAIERGGTPVSVFAPSAQAARGVLRDEGFKNAETLERLLIDERLQGQVKGQALWIDEAGLVSNRDMRRLAELAERNGNRLILSGDYRQHRSVGAGDAFRLLESEAGVQYAELKEIRRQRAADYRAAVAELSKGTDRGAREAFALLDRMGAIVEAPEEDRHRLLVGDYLTALREGKSALVVAPTHAEGEALTEAIRSGLKASDQLGNERTFIARKAAGWTDAQKRDSRNYRDGMLVEFNQATSGQRVRLNGARATIGGFAKGEVAAVAGQESGRVVLLRQDGSRALLPDAHSERFQVYTTRELRIAEGERVRILKNGAVPGEAGRDKRLNNGDVFTVTGFTRQGDMRLSNGAVVPKSYGHFGRGYVETSHGSQGKTVDRVFIAAGDASLAAVNAEQFYVSVSRGREAAKVYVESKHDVRQAITKSTSRLAAVELMKAAPKQDRLGDLRERFSRNRALNYLKSRQQALMRTWQARIERDRQGRSASRG